MEALTMGADYDKAVAMLPQTMMLVEKKKISRQRNTEVASFYR
jgi:hypothetical protein